MKTLMNLTLVITIFLLFNCSGIKSHKWKSQYYNFEIEYTDNWKVYEKSDTKERLLFGIIDISDGKQYHIDMTTHSEHKNLSEEDYFGEMEKYYLSLNDRNKFLNNEEIELHGEKFYGKSFLFYNKKYGAQKLYDIVKRDSDLVIGITITFPTDENNCETQTVPNELLELDRHVKINEK